MIEKKILKLILKKELHLKSFRGILLDFVPCNKDGKTWPRGTNIDEVGNIENSLDRIIKYLNTDAVHRIDIIRIMEKGNFQLRIGELYKTELQQHIREIKIDNINS
jgi:hypothetical protein